MDGVSTASAASNDTMKRLIDDFERTQDILREARDQISHGFEDLRYEREALTAENSVIDANGSKILRIKAGGGDHIHEQGQSDTDKRDYAGGSILCTVVEAVAKGRLWKDISRR